jgi:hypothetical protein
MANPSLHLVHDGGDAVVDFGAANEAAQDQACLLSEARALQATYGRNAYSDFLQTRGRRPDPAEAATIGRLLGARVRSSDGSMQPPLSAAERAALRLERAEVRREVEKYSRIRRLKNALAYLSDQSDPTEIIGVLRTQLDESVAAAQLDSAIRWLSRLSETLHEQRSQSSIPDSQSSD